MEPKRRRRCLSVGDKLKLLERMKSESITQISRNCNINESTLRTLQRNEKQLREYAENCSSGGMNTVSYVSHNYLIDQMERTVLAWILAERKMGRRHTVADVCAKAKDIYDTLREAENACKADDDGGDDDIEHCSRSERDFKGSKGWYRKFRKRFNLDGIQDTDLDDPEVVAQYKQKFKRLIRVENYEPQQVFAATEFSLKWKALPAHSAIARNDRSGVRACHDRVSLLMCANASGDFTVKPILVYRRADPKCMRFINYNELPVYWRSRTRPSESHCAVTMEHFHDWLHECFIPNVRGFLQIMEFPSRCVLLVDAEMEPFVQAFNDNCDDQFLRLECMPKCTVLQPLRRTAVPVFQCRYYEHMYQHYRGQLGSAASLKKLVNVWREYSIADAIDTMHMAMEDMTAFVWQTGWLQLWQEIVAEDKSDFASTLSDAVQRVVVTCKCLPGEGFADITAPDVYEMLKLKPSAGNDENIDQQEASMPNDVHLKRKHKDNTADVLKKTKLSTGNNKDNWLDLSDPNDDDGDVDSNTEIDDNEDYLERFLIHDEKEQEQQRAIKAETTTTLERCNKLSTRNESTQTVEYPASTMTSSEPSAHRIISAENKKTLRTLNQAFALSHQMSELLATVHHKSVDNTKFLNDLSHLLQPYKALREGFVQTSIKDYFRQK